MASNELLKQIQAGKRLKKSETNDRSAPAIEVKPATGGVGVVRRSGPASSPPANTAAAASAPQLGGLLAGGKPTLKPLGQRTFASPKPPPVPRKNSTNTSSSAPSPPPAPSRLLTPPAPVLPFSHNRPRDQSSQGDSASLSFETRKLAPPMPPRPAALQNSPARPTPPAPPRPSSSAADRSDSVSTSPYIPRPRSSLASAHTKSASTSRLNGVSGRSSIPSPPPRAGRFMFPVTDFPPPRPFTDQPRTYNGGRKRGSDFDTTVLYVR